MLFAGPVPVLFEFLFVLGIEHGLFDAIGQIAAYRLRPIHGVLPAGVVVVSGQQNDVVDVAILVSDGADIGFPIV